MNAITLLEADHEKVKKLLAEPVDDRARHQDPDRTLRDDEGRADAPRDHRGRDLYPELKAHPKAKDIVLEGYEEHHVVDVLMSELEALDVSDDPWGAKALVMKENIDTTSKRKRARCSRRRVRSSTRLSWRI